MINKRLIREVDSSMKYVRLTVLCQWGMLVLNIALIAAVAMLLEDIIRQESIPAAQAAATIVLALIVMYDATGVRWAAGLHAKAINYIVEYLGDENTKDKDQLKEMIPKLNESLGHRMIEVVCGALLGFAISLIGYFCF